MRAPGGAYPAGGTHSPVLVVGSGGGAAGAPAASFAAWICVTKSWLSGARFAIGALGRRRHRGSMSAGLAVTYWMPQFTRSWATVLPGAVKMSMEVFVMLAAASSRACFCSSVRPS